MKNLLLMRHATAGEKPEGQKDQDRELTLFGERQAGEAGEWLKKQGLVPQLIMCSPSVRTTFTCLGVLDALEKNISIQKETSIYSGSEKDLLHLVQDVSEEVDTLLLVGHNPTISFFASELAHEEISFSPANVAVISFGPMYWHEIKKGQGKLVNFYAG